MDRRQFIAGSLGAVAGASTLGRQALAQSSAELDALIAVERADRSADLLAEHPLERHAAGKRRRHLNAELRQGSRDLAADEAHPDDHGASTRRHLGLDRLALAHRPKLMDPRQLGAGNVEAPVSPSRRDQDVCRDGHVEHLLSDNAPNQFPDPPVGPWLEREHRGQVRGDGRMLELDGELKQFVKLASHFAPFCGGRVLRLLARD